MYKQGDRVQFLGDPIMKGTVRDVLDDGTVLRIEYDNGCIAYDADVDVEPVPEKK